MCVCDSVFCCVCASVGVCVWYMSDSFLVVSANQSKRELRAEMGCASVRERGREREEKRRDGLCVCVCEREREREKCISG